jgi:hypothetical protein
VPNDPQSLYTQAQCYLCFGVTDVQALELPLWANIANATVTPITTLEPMVIDLFDPGNNSMAANTVYFYGKMSARLINTVYGNAAIDIPRAGIIKRVQYLIDISSTLGTAAQNLIHAITINNATDAASSSFDYSATPISQIVNLSQVVNQGDTIAFKITTPAIWTTPALAVRVVAQVYIE